MFSRISSVNKAENDNNLFFFFIVEILLTLLHITLEMTFIFIFSFSVHNLESEDSYLVNLDLHVCFETTGPCVFSTSVLSNVKLPQTKCDWSAGKGLYTYIFLFVVLGILFSKCCHYINNT